MAQPQPTRTSGPYSGGTNAVGPAVDTDLNTLYTVLQGGIGDTHIAPDAAIQISKLQAAAWTAYTPSFTGFSAAPTVTARYMVIGKKCTVSLYTLSTGTSNATTFTMTLPFAAANIATIQSGVITTVDNSNPLIGVIQTAQNSAVATLFATNVLGSWSTSGNKYANFSDFSYETV